MLSFLLSRQKEGLCHACGTYRSAGAGTLLERAARQVSSGVVTGGAGGSARWGTEPVLDCAGDARCVGIAPPDQERGSAGG